MARENFTSWEPKTGPTKALLDAAIAVINDYETQGYQLTLRQLYYQLVARDLIPNNLREYKRLGDVLKNAREGGWVDWDSIVDRGRVPVVPPQWTGPQAIIDAAARQFRLDRWLGQEYYVELWCEKDALSSILEPIASRYHVRFMANRGYSSATAMYDAAQRFVAAGDRSRQGVIIYLGDHDPSGMDMTRDIRDRSDLLSGNSLAHPEVIRLALNYDQVTQYQPPPNPTKLTDSRAEGYIVEFGGDSWELDALEPSVLDQITSAQIEELLDLDKYNARIAEEEAHKDDLRSFGEWLAERSASEEEEHDDE